MGGKKKLQTREKGKATEKQARAACWVANEPLGGPWGRILGKTEKKEKKRV